MASSSVGCTSRSGAEEGLGPHAHRNALGAIASPASTGHCPSHRTRRLPLSSTTSLPTNFLPTPRGMPCPVRSREGLQCWKPFTDGRILGLARHLGQQLLGSSSLVRPAAHCHTPLASLWLPSSEAGMATRAGRQSSSWKQWVLHHEGTTALPLGHRRW